MKGIVNRKSEIGNPLKPFLIRDGHVTLRVWPARQSPPLWEIEYTDPEHGRRRVKRAKRADAEAEARRIAGRLTRGQFLVEGRQAADYSEAELVATRWNVTVAEMARHYDRARTAEAAKPVQDKTNAEIIAAFLERKKKSRGGLHHRDLRLRLARFERDVRCPLGEITALALESWLESLRVGIRTQHNYLAAVANLMAFARARHWIPDSLKPAEQVELPQATTDVSTQLYAPHEIRELLGHVAESVLPAVAIGAFAGLRPSEVLCLQWSDIVWDEGVITVPARTKTGRRLARLSDNLRAWLKPLAGNGPVVRMGWSGLGQALRRAARKAGVTLKDDGFRHSYVSYRCALTRDTSLVADECGHSVAMLRRTYRELVTPRAAAEWFAIMPSLSEKVVELSTKVPNISPLIPLSRHGASKTG